MKYVIVHLIIGLFLFACGSSDNKPVDREALRREMKEREIKHVLPGEIIEAAYGQGDSLAQMAQQVLIRQYQKNPSEQKLADYFKNETSRSVDSLERAYAAKIRWVSLQDTLPQQLSDLEKQILDAYRYNVEQEMEIDHNVQRIDDESYLYTQPVMQSELQQMLAASQPSPADTNQFLGMWSIVLSKKEIIINM